MAVTNGNKIYYNINIPYDDTSSCDACEARVLYNTEETVLCRASDYYASVINFSLPVSSVPIMFTDIEKFPNTDVNKTVYKVALEFDGDVSTESLIFIPSDSQYSAPSAPTAGNPIVPRSYYYAIYTYNKFVNMLNTALAIAFTNLASTPGGSIAPRVTFDPNSNRFSFVVDANYLSNLAPNVGVRIYLGYELFQFFTGFDVARTGFKTADARDYQIQVVDNGNLAGGFYTVQQDYSTISNWNCLRSLQLRAPGMDTQQESVPSSRVGSDGRASKASILASFNPIYDNSPGGAVPRSQIQFSLNSAYRLIDMLTSGPLNRMSIAIWWTDELNISYPLILNYRELIQVKLCFHLKETYAG